MQGNRWIPTRRAALKSLGLLGAGSLAPVIAPSASAAAHSASDPAFERLPVLFDTDVLVVGGGPAGMCAAIAAARAGAKVAIIERWPHTLIACTGGNPLDSEELTRATMDARAKAPAFLRCFRENWPGCEKLRLAYAAPALGVRESRRVRGLYTFTGANIRERRSFPDAVGHGFWMVDIHDPAGSGHTTWSDKNTHLEPGTTYQIPYRILVAADLDNLLVAGRCASATHEGMAGLRVQSHCHIMGQAAGTAAALSLSAGVRPADVEVARLQKQLIDAGVLIDLNRVEQAKGKS